MALRKVVFFDLETNGKAPIRDSVLSISVIKATICTETFEITDEIRETRYYETKLGENYKIAAYRVHGLDEEKILELRKGVKYPSHYMADDWFYNFLKDVTSIVSHNIIFDVTFFPDLKARYPLLRPYCTMRNLKNVLKIPFKRPKNPTKKYINSGYKWPRLDEIAEFFNVKFDRHAMHTSKQDTEVVFECFKKMLKLDETKELALTALKPLTEEELKKRKENQKKRQTMAKKSWLEKKH